MEIKHQGEVCILDLGDLSRRVLYEMRKHDSTIANKDRAMVDDMLSTMADDQLTMGMYWTKRKAEFNPKRYLDLIRPLIKKHPRVMDLLHMADDAIAEQLAEVIELPTWHILHLRRHRGLLEIEMGEDYRIRDWMQKFAKEYDVVEIKSYDW